MTLALSIQQPWAWLICHADSYPRPKRVENRTWRTPVRGRFLVHAGARPDPGAFEEIVELRPDLRSVLVAAAARGEMRNGGIVGMAELVDCWPVERRPFEAADDHGWAFGPWCFELRHARHLPFRPLKGKLGFFEVEEPAAGINSAALLPSGIVK